MMTHLTSSTDKGLDSWQYLETQLKLDSAGYNESLFAIGNGYIGVRGYFDEGYPEEVPNTASSCFLNGVYESLPIEYDESAYGLAKNCHRIIDVPRLEFLVRLDDVVFNFNQGKVVNYRRSLNFKNGVYSRQLDWHAPDGKQLRLNFERVALSDNKSILLNRLSVTALNFSGIVVVDAQLNADNQGHITSDDPREGGAVPPQNWKVVKEHQVNNQSQFAHLAVNSNIQVVSTMQTSHLGQLQPIQHGQQLIHRHTVDIREGEAVSLTAVVSYLDSRSGDRNSILQKSGSKLCQWFSGLKYRELLQTQQQLVGDFWNHADIRVESDDNSQFATRFSLFHLYQSTGYDGLSSIAAKGVTGAGYDGHYFWDSEVYVFPFWLFSDPIRAKGLLQYRVNHLSSAREHARKLGHEHGALFSWRTIGGEECSSFFPAGSAQYHINADIAYASRSYIRITGDIEFLQNGLAELILETARIWMEIGHFSDLNDGRFGIHEVTGPDEYTAMTDNNYYTNKLAQSHLFWAIEVLDIVNEVTRKALFSKLDIHAEEIKNWRRAATNMILPFNEELGIIEQHDGFLKKPKWDFKGTQKEKHPLLLHFHPLKIYRHQVLKQADGLLALLMDGDHIDVETKVLSFDYYEPITTHDSTLSSCVHGILANEIGYYDLAHDYILETLNLDLLNKHNNTHYGVHTAAMGGVWMGLVQGFAGLRYEQGILKFTPKLPDEWRCLCFKLQILGASIEIELNRSHTYYRYLEGNNVVSLQHRNKKFKLSPTQIEYEVKHD